ncbi:aminotransferase class I/II-fold pyridoxal phosphate-dependent enzyme [Nonomuraea typhae]|uniref:aminotransferase class I/II-fold pyridoxal phosphate-dependent enzyme n=1 Tax=Nonomuraea typhae TaxID=2603600 RepID=UPI0012FBAA33|nr:aminotransferase class I/II-fold pyridoxal phosphate-dependent enzyme [Nonomuraea typhae]
MPSAPDRLDERLNAFHLERVSGTWAGRLMLTRREQDPDAIILTGGDYLALAHHPAIVAAMTHALRTPAVHQRQDRTEAEFAGFLGATAAVLCPSGWAANTGLMQLIADRDIPVYLDERAHRSLREGARGARAPVVGFRHNDVDDLLAHLSKHGSGVIAVDAVYGTDGAICPLADVAEAARAHNCLLVVDESHSLGTHGARGEGLAARVGADFRTASLAKAIPGRAGLIVCDRPEFVPYFRHLAYPAVFSSPLLPHDLAGLSATLSLVKAEDWRRTRLREITRRLRQEFTAMGYDLEPGHAHILALGAGRDTDVILARDLLEQRGVYGAAHFPPAGSGERGLVRLSLHAALSDQDIDRIVGACRDIRTLCGF